MDNKYTDRIDGQARFFKFYLQECLSYEMREILNAISRKTEVYVFSGVIRNFFLGETIFRDLDIVVGDVESQGDWNYCTELADLLNEEGININSARSYSRGGDDGWDWIIIQVCYNSEG